MVTILGPVRKVSSAQLSNSYPRITFVVLLQTLQTATAAEHTNQIRVTRTNSNCTTINMFRQYSHVYAYLVRPCDPHILCLLPAKFFSFIQIILYFHIYSRLMLSSYSYQRITSIFLSLPSSWFDHVFTGFVVNTFTVIFFRNLWPCLFTIQFLI